MTVFDVVRRLPDVPRVREISQAIALLDAILSPDWSSRYFSFDAEWAPGEALASMRNGSGDEYSIVAYSPNPTADSRAGTITVRDKVVAITQAGRP